MATKKLKPMTPGTRHRIAPVFDDVTTKHRNHLYLGIGKSGGRNHHGRKTSRHRGGGHKRRYRIIDFKRNKFDIPAKVQTIEYDPNRTARINFWHMLMVKKDTLLHKWFKVGDSVISGECVAPDMGNALRLRHMPPGTFVHAVELRPGAGATICVVGTVAQY